ncbi:unnamed protein product [Effrenium voratum]|uniref:Uncharacterized protein n=1 Tax=Effrenium voratum TaxID=2562239 RepID=A0AA36MPH8_9DINO|nr:unnamed protein product [Effrenium voratum]CAJ1439846.1 unnamed protein product [Effrenium voratum]
MRGVPPADQLRFGPRIPRHLVEPRKKLPFGPLALWAPNDPEEVTRLYFEQSGQSTDFMNICRGRKVHARSEEFDLEVPCAQLATLATAWAPLPLEGAEAQEVMQTCEHLLQERLPGLTARDGSRIHEVLRADAATETAELSARYLARWQGTNADLGPMICTALLWRGDPEEDLRHPGALTSLPVRSLVCGQQGVEPHFVWEEGWL